MVSQSTKKELLGLSAADRIRVAQDLWDSVADQSDQLPLSEEERSILDQRLSAYNADPQAGDDWQTVRQRIKEQGGQ